ncbi:MAG: hypothetical protein IPQ01_05345 [Zoogloea sp.]|jgi:hypothetical protein|nr:hypothetical protein [Zoogloea sp.]
MSSPLDNSDTKKKGVERTYMGFDGYAPIADYLAEEGNCLGLELRLGTQLRACSERCSWHQPSGTT